ncbi:DNA-binding transcriptional response regulator, NtrC family, contains REC, AAA-type ATPase, and a Fis-type DNA-binding domains [Nannocystis exedens]|uniref:DNA-binding transcriptional response regulator, NtrC family, contains REC, AAA-type ATPase, and a Fis-type DNA-binding domains n=1 Tax=Nannocystis exedens TaxID=54 RepID=A0A1I2GWF2_9BACT|nr:sigma 54-interacting transcriptional regulator [Nannocystis exedens]SFF21117.1 DNA-binding transcriptional response regulator, NtrC family, contains REC, AAA-type ATPase, and a Fis-type DNA-binding domains [Nannocystis exedens]
MGPRKFEKTPFEQRSAEETASTERSARICAAPRTARLVLVHPRGLGEPQALGEAPVVLGRQRDAGQLVAAHKTVSRRHATFCWDPAAGCHTVADLGSRNGTWVDGRSVHALPVYLEDQAVLRFGDVLAVYERRDTDLRDAPQVSTDAVPGDSLAARKLRLAIGRAGPDLAPALILGETGVGKERIAGELHRLSGRRGPLVAVNCAALSPQLVESQLFGHTRGAFTGATTEQPGMFRAAAGGTLFLDELGELPLDLQPKLLRAVELGEVVAVGSTQSHRVDVRLIAATNRSLVDDVEQGKFRRDLYARLALWEIHAPPLRARRADLLAWVDRLHRAWHAPRSRGEPPPIELPVALAEALLLQPWPDNLRGLQRFVHAYGAADGDVDPEAWPARLLSFGAGPPAAAPAPAAVAPAAPAGDTPPARTVPRAPRPRPSREALLATLEANGWSIRATAKHYECERKQITRWLGMYAIAVPGRDAEE